MSRDSDALNFSKKNQREMSEFLTQELIYDYYFNSLDAPTRALMEKKLESDRELQTEIGRLKLADNYLAQIKKLQMRDHFIIELKNHETFLQLVDKRIRNTKVPASLKWTLEGSAAILVILFVLWLLPFNKLTHFRWSFDGPSTLAEVHKSSDKSQDESAASVPAPQAPPINVTVPTVVQNPPTENEGHQDFKFKDEIAATPKPEAKPTKTEPVAKQTKQSADASEEEAGAPRGVLYRADISVVNAEAASAKIKEKIEALGGRRAGEVDIGWEKTKDNFYYHFTIPAAKSAEMEAFIAEYGKFTVHEEQHPRKIPANLRRYIFTLSEKRK